MKPITENIIEESAIEILQSQGWEYANGKEISPEGLFCERENLGRRWLWNLGEYQFGNGVYFLQCKKEQEHDGSKN